MYAYRWDLDKTYLETDFDTVRGLVRSATEPAHAKRAVPGATALIRALSRREGAKVFILSGSPTQMRQVLEEKLRLDGVPFEELVLKDNLGNLRRGRLRAIRGQLGYKLPTLLQARAGLTPDVHEALFGDDAEVDALAYSIYADVLAGRLSAAELSRILEAAGAYPDNIELALDAVPRLNVGNAVDRIFIRLARNAPPDSFAPLGDRVVPVFAWWQAALVLVEMGQLDMAAADEVLAESMAADALDAWSAAAVAQDVVARGLVDGERLRAWRWPNPVARPLRAAMSHLAVERPARERGRPTGADYLNLVRQWVH